MRIYKVHFYEGCDGSRGYKYFASFQEARKQYREFEEDYPDSCLPSERAINAVSFDLTKRGILDLLNCHADHPDNG